MKAFLAIILLASFSAKAQLFSSFAKYTEFYKNELIVDASDFSFVFQDKIEREGIDDGKKEFFLAPIIALKVGSLEVEEYTFYTCPLWAKIKDRSIGKTMLFVEEDYDVYVRHDLCSRLFSKSIRENDIIQSKWEVLEGQKTTLEHFMDVMDMISLEFNENILGKKGHTSDSEMTYSRPWTMQKTIRFLDFVVPFVVGAKVDKILNGPGRNPLTKKYWKAIVDGAKKIRKTKFSGANAGKIAKIGARRAGGFLAFMFLEILFSELRKIELSNLRGEMIFLEGFLSMINSYQEYPQNVCKDHQFDIFFTSREDLIDDDFYYIEIDGRITHLNSPTTRKIQEIISKIE